MEDYEVEITTEVEKVEKEKKLIILCPYCNKPYTSKMKHKLFLSEGSYTPDCVGSKMVSSIDIYCSNCKKLVYKKEIREDIDYLDWEKDSDE